MGQQLTNVKAHPGTEAGATRHRVTQTFAYIVVTAGAIIFMIPFVWMLSSSLKPLDQIFVGTAGLDT